MENEITRYLNDRDCCAPWCCTSCCFSTCVRLVVDKWYMLFIFGLIVLSILWGSVCISGTSKASLSTYIGYQLLFSLCVSFIVTTKPIFLPVRRGMESEGDIWLCQFWHFLYDKGEIFKSSGKEGLTPPFWVFGLYFEHFVMQHLPIFFMIISCKMKT